MSAPVRVFCYASDPNEALDDWLLTAKRCGYTPQVIGLGTPWLGFKQKSEGWASAAERIATDHPDEPILFTDSYDVLFNAPASRALQVLQECGKPILVGMEPACLSNCVGVQPGQDRERLKYINSGVIMGKALPLAQLLRESVNVRVDDDQYALGTVCQRDGGGRVAFDTQRRLVANLTPWRDLLHLSKAQNQVLVDGQAPCILHFPSTVSDGMLREGYVRSTLVGPHRRPSWSDVLEREVTKAKASWQERIQLTAKWFGGRTVNGAASAVVALILLTALVLYWRQRKP
jgi:hypothetical protein